MVAGPLLASKARAAGVIYSLAWGDQPALICEHVDWARAAGFEVVSAGKGTRYHPTFHQSTPDTVWDNFGLPPEVVAQGRHESENVQLVHRRHQVRHRDDGGVQRDRPDAAAGRALVPAVVGLRPCEGLQAEGFGRQARDHRHDRSGLVAASRQVAGREPSAGRHLRGGQVRARVRAALRAGIQHPARRDLRAHGAVPADPHDRARARHLGRLRGAAQGGDRRADRLPLRRGGDREEEHEEGRDARRRGRLLRVGQADAGRPLARRGHCCRSALRTTSSSSATSRPASCSNGPTSNTTRTISP